MTYELAKELKEAEFETKMQTGFRRGYYEEKEKSYMVYFPTLEELIEACGHGFESMRRMFDGTETLGWEAWSANLDVFNRMFHGEGSTPTEAVARLWLELNKK